MNVVLIQVLVCAGCAALPLGATKASNNIKAIMNNGLKWQINVLLPPLTRPANEVEM